MTLVDFEADGNPVDVVERLATVDRWSFSRANEDEVTILVAGEWTHYQVSFTWMAGIQSAASRLRVRRLRSRRAAAPR